MSKSASYSPCHCTLDCEQLDRDAEPCWGPVQVVDAYWYEDEDVEIHACEGHAYVSAGGYYKPEPKTDPHR